jgi:predicted TIM-barrel fold metal-dependent hydrolase
VLFGSDYPHPEGLAEPRDYLQRVDGLDAGELDLVMHDNATALLGLAATA